MMKGSMAATLALSAGQSLRGTVLQGHVLSRQISVQAEERRAHRVSVHSLPRESDESQTHRPVCISSREAATRTRLAANGSRRKRDQFANVILTDPETGVAPAKTGAAICVQNVDVQCVLQFTLIHAAGCVLHRHTSRVIHRSE